MSAEEERLLSVNEIAEKLRVNGSTIRRMIYQGEFPNAFKLERRWRIPEKDLRDFIEMKRRERQNITMD